jgi:hypothetical protein
MIWWNNRFNCIGLIRGGSRTVQINTQTIQRQHNRHKQYIEQHSSLIRKSADCAPSLRGIPWRLPYNWGKRSRRKSHSFLSLPADTTMASSQCTSVSSNSFSRWASYDIFLFKYHFLLHVLRFLFFLSDNIMADVASKQQPTVLF